MSEHSRGRETARLRDGAPAVRWAPLERHRRGVRDARRVAEDAPSWSRGRTRAGRAASGARSMRNGSRKATRSFYRYRSSAACHLSSRSILYAPRPECFGESSTVFFRALATFGAPAPPAMRQCAAEEIQHNTQSGLRSASIVTTNSTSRGDLPRRADVLEHGGEPDVSVRPKRYP